MANMSYCRFQNTLLALQDCKEALDEIQDGNEEELPKKGSEEYWAMLHLICHCKYIADNHNPEDYK